MKDEHESLVEQIALRFAMASSHAGTDFARAVLALIAEKLQTVTPEMQIAWSKAWGLHVSPSAEVDWVTMLAASPLTPRQPDRQPDRQTEAPQGARENEEMEDG
jgi:hypothetical protein